MKLVLLLLGIIAAECILFVAWLHAWWWVVSL